MQRLCMGTIYLDVLLEFQDKKVKLNQQFKIQLEQGLFQLIVKYIQWEASIIQRVQKMPYVVQLWVLHPVKSIHNFDMFPRDQLRNFDCSQTLYIEVKFQEQIMKMILIGIINYKVLYERKNQLFKYCTFLIILRFFFINFQIYSSLSFINIYYNSQYNLLLKMMQSFKITINKVIQIILQKKGQLSKRFITKKTHQIKQDLQQMAIVESKALSLLFLVLQNDFDTKGDDIEGFFLKIQKIKQQLNKKQDKIKQKQVGGLSERQQNQFLRQDDSANQLKKSKGTQQLQNNKQIRQRFYTQTTDKNFIRNRNSTNFIFTEQQEDEGDKQQKQQFIGGSIQYEDSYYSQQIFNIYHKLPLGILKDKSFEARSESYKTMNYQKILFFLEELCVKSTAQQRLLIIKILKKQAKNIKYIIYQQFTKIFVEIKKLMKILNTSLDTLIQNKKQLHKASIAKKKYLIQYSPNNKSFIKKMQNRSKAQTEKKTIRSRLIDRMQKQQQKSYLQNSNYKLKDHFSSHSSNNSKLYIQNAIQKLKVRTLIWQKVCSFKQASVFQGISMPNIKFNQQNKDQDYYYLQDFNPNDTAKTNKQDNDNQKLDKYEKYGKLNKMKIILPSINIGKNSNVHNIRTNTMQKK